MKMNSQQLAGVQKLLDALTNLRDAGIEVFGNNDCEIKLGPFKPENQIAVLDHYYEIDYIDKERNDYQT